MLAHDDEIVEIQMRISVVNVSVYKHSSAPYNEQP